MTDSSEQPPSEQEASGQAWDPAAERVVPDADPGHDPAGDPAQRQEWLGQNTLMYGGLIGIGVVLVQPFLTAPASIDLSARICIGSFSLAIPILAALILLNRQEIFRRQPTRSRLVQVTQGTGQGLAMLGIVAGFWHLSWLAGAGVLVGGLTGLIAYTVGYAHLDRDAGFIDPVAKKKP